MEERKSLSLLSFVVAPFMVALLLFLIPSFSSANTIDCNQGTLKDLVDCIESHMPVGDSEGYIPPSSDQRDDWIRIVGDMLDGEVDCAVISLGSLDGIYSIFSFADSGALYCVAMEVAAHDDSELQKDIVDRGLGTIIVNQSPTRELVIQIPHAMAEINTHKQGAYVFKGTDARVFLMSGAHRYANTATTSCQGEHESDMSHDSDNFFQDATIEIDFFYSDIGKYFTSVQFHGMAAENPNDPDPCDGTDVFITYGINAATDTGETIDKLRTKLIDNGLDCNPDACIIKVAGEGSCDLYATKNVQGRYLNGISDDSVCDVYAAGYTGKLIHIEQKPTARNYNDTDYEVWSQSFIDTNFSPLIKVGNNYYSTLQAAYSAASYGDTIKSQKVLLIENFETDGTDKYVIFEGGYNSDFTDIIGITTLRGQFHSNDFGVIKLRNFRLTTSQ